VIRRKGKITRKEMRRRGRRRKRREVPVKSSLETEYQDSGMPSSLLSSLLSHRMYALWFASEFQNPYIVTLPKGNTKDVEKRGDILDSLELPREPFVLMISGRDEN